jgi:putative flippase GtrA
VSSATAVGAGSSVVLFLRHQAGAIMATFVDFLIMVAWVELGHGSAVTGTALGAACGATTNFVIGRRWIFRVDHHPAGWQALRYALVSTGSLALNSLGQHLMLKTWGLHGYVFTRGIVAATVALLWNFPLHRFFVFRSGGRREPA